MKKLKCLINRYIGRGLDLNEGDIAEVDDNLAAELLTDFPDWFEVIEEKDVKERDTKDVKSRQTK